MFLKIQQVDEISKQLIKLRYDPPKKVIPKPWEIRKWPLSKEEALIWFRKDKLSARKLKKFFKVNNWPSPFIR